MQKKIHVSTHSLTLHFRCSFAGAFVVLGSGYFYYFNSTIVVAARLQKNKRRSRVNQVDEAPTDAGRKERANENELSMSMYLYIFIFANVIGSK